MLRIHFTVGDLARLRMSPGLGPGAESVFTLNLLARNDTIALRPLARRVRAEWGAAVFDRLLREHRSQSALLELLSSPDTLVQGTGIPGDDRSQVLAEISRTVVLPHWNRIRAHLEQVRASRGRIVIANGIQGLLSSVHPRVHWNPPVLEVHHGRDADVHLNGRGLLLSPGFFLHERFCLFVETVGGIGQPALVFPVDAATKPEVWTSWKFDEQALGHLVGHTRAAALQALTSGCTTGMLADRLGISMAGASKHAAVLRRSGLITTMRRGNSALHELTRLGRALLNNPVHAKGSPDSRSDPTSPPRAV